MGKVTGFAFQQLLELLNIKSIPTTNKNPQSNAICEKMHQTVTSVLKTLLLAQPPQTHCQAEMIVNDALATAMHAISSMVSITLQPIPGGLAFSWDMILNIPLLAYWHNILTQREQLVNDALLCANKKHNNFDYQIGKKFSNITKFLRHA